MKRFVGESTWDSYTRGKPSRDKSISRAAYQAAHGTARRRLAGDNNDLIDRIVFVVVTLGTIGRQPQKALRYMLNSLVHPLVAIK